MGKKLIFAVMAFVSFIFLLGVVIDVLAQDPQARNIQVFRVDGYDARIARSSGARERNVREEQRLTSGNVISTGRDT